eukprot:c6959_g1_i1 orf=71-388(+)
MRGVTEQWWEERRSDRQGRHQRNPVPPNLPFSTLWRRTCLEGATGFSWKHYFRDAFYTKLIDLHCIPNPRDENTQATTTLQQSSLITFMFPTRSRVPFCIKGKPK